MCILRPPALGSWAQRGWRQWFQRLSLMVDSSEQVPIGESTKQACCEGKHSVSLLFQDRGLCIISTCSHAFSAPICLCMLEIIAIDVPNWDFQKLKQDSCKGKSGFAFYMAQTDPLCHWNPLSFIETYTLNYAWSWIRNQSTSLSSLRTPGRVWGEQF